MNFHESLAAGREGMTFTVVSVVTVMIVGVVLGRLLRIDRKNSYLISSGTAICGGSAIAAVAPVIDADENQTSLSLATIFILNAVALFVFPVIGHWLGMGAEPSSEPGPRSPSTTPVRSSAPVPPTARRRSR